MNVLAFRSIPEVAKRFFRPWLEFKWIRKFTDYDKKVGHFQKLSDVVVNGVSVLIYFKPCIRLSVFVRADYSTFD